MDFLLRDDDICFFTKVEDFKKNWGWFLEKDFAKLNLAVIPFVFPKEFGYNETDLKVLGENKDLVLFLKDLIKEKKVEILLHGYSHKTQQNKFEFNINDKKLLFKKIKEAKSYLESLFNIKILTFVPPHNSLSRQALEVISENRLNILAAFPTSFFKIGFNFEYSYFFLKRFIFSKLNSKYLKGFYIYPFKVKFSSHTQLDCINFLPNIFSYSDLICLINMIKEKNGILCLATHYWQMKEKDLELLKKIIYTLVEDKNITFKFASQVLNG